MKKIIFSAIFTVMALAINAQNLRFSNAFSDNAILQQNSTVKVWGWDVQNRDIMLKCSWIEEAIKTRTDYHGRWVAEVETLPASFTPYSMTAISATQSITIGNILFGDVWFCSGQSNMEMRMERNEEWRLDIVGLDEALDAPANSYLRYINVTRDESFSRKEDTATTGWIEFSSESIEWVSAIGYYFANQIYRSENIPIGLFINAYGGSPIQAWIPRDAIDESEYESELKALNEEFAAGNERPYYERMSCLYNALTHPFIDYGIKGWLWYQGESNVADEVRYKSQTKDLVASWRKAWGNETLPFYYVQLAPYVYESFKNQQWSKFAVAQQDVAKEIDNCEMVVIADVGIPDNVHPCYKQEVADRLSRVALANVYGHSEVEWRSAEPISVSAQRGSVVVTFDNAYDGLHFDDSRCEVEISFDGENFIKAQSAEAKGSEIIAKHKGKESPKAIRFCWYDESSSNLFNSAGLPVGPFKLDITN